MEGSAGRHQTAFQEICGLNLRFAPYTQNPSADLANGLQRDWDKVATGAAVTLLLLDS